MIEELGIKGLGVIEDAHLEFSPHFTVVTGETGAGKTMVVTGLGLLMGERADSGALRQGVERAVVEGRWTLPADSRVTRRVVDAGGSIEDDSLLILRSMNAQGRSRAHAGGAAVPVSVLAEIADELVALHGQSDQQHLTQPTRQRSLLDAFAKVQPVLHKYHDCYRKLATAESELAALVSERKERRQEADLLRFGLDEIAEVSPVSGEDASLKAEGQRLAHAEDLRTAAQTARQSLGADDDQPAAGQFIQDAIRALDAMKEHDSRIAELVEQLTEIEVLAADVGSELRAYLEEVEADPQRLTEVNDRRSLLTQLTRKYGGTVDEVLQWQQTSSKRLIVLEATDDDVERLSADVGRLRAQLAEHAEELSSLRTKAAKKLAQQATKELTVLAMPAAQLIVDVRDEPVSDDANDIDGLTMADGRRVAFGPEGIDVVDFLLQPHPDAPARPLGKGASGGELSRVMLAIEVTVAAVNPVPTFIFDEVDAGVGGEAAVEVGRRLAALARHSQVIVVTHLPQVAAFADLHLVVTKGSQGTVTSSNITRVEQGDRARELARMLAGLADSPLGQAHAEELLEIAQRR